MSDAAALVSSQGGLLVPVHRRTAQLPLYEDVFGLAALTENVMLLTEAINPVLVHATRPHDGAGAAGGAPSTAPRVVDVIRKTLQGPTWDGRTAVLPRPRPALRTHSLSLPRPSVTSTGRPHASRGSRSPSPVRREEQRQQTEKQTSASSTAAYLASLELLASHYRHQALANAKQLQLQQRLLMQTTTTTTTTTNTTATATATTSATGTTRSEVKRGDGGSDRGESTRRGDSERCFERPDCE
ncbi:uncharacterized protein LOC119590438 [Penaeus monodon]|uniref:uncharacterized protein LOC119590438 n=1 Tax=Penaeus monodon TaxID=6687 RepID=UPI0018A754F5|nr:uncharacterized protein LOC119590438 [Penaeus monodon]XP_037795036.1 uncharacterized protein LOC119590438 [Penaeus monodon]